MKQIKILMASFLTLSLLASCSSTEESGGSQSSSSTGTTGSTVSSNAGESHVTVAPYRWVEGWDPHLDWNGVNATRFMVCEGLVGINEKFEIEPVLATSWEQEDEVTYRFKIREGVTFFNGNPCDATAMKASLERSVVENERGGDARIDTVEVDGDDLIITTQGAFSTFLYNLTDSMYSIIDVSDLEDSNNNPMGTGAYIVESIVPEESVSLVLNDDYWGQMPSIEEITVVNIAHDTKVSAVLAGTVDVAQGPTASTVSSGENNSAGVAIMTLEGVREYDLILNCRDGHPFSDLALRQAVSYGLNREVLTQIIGDGYATAIYGPFPEKANYGFDQVTGQSYDPEKSKEILAENGYVDLDGDGYVEGLNGETLDFKLTFTPSIYGTAMSEGIQDMLKSVGIKVTLESQESFSYNPDDHVDNDMSLDGGSSLNAGDGQKFLTNGFTTGGSENYGGYANSDYDEIMVRLDQTFDVDERMEIYIEAQQFLIDDVANCWIYAPDDVYIVSSRVEGVSLHPLNYYFVTPDWTLND